MTARWTETLIAPVAARLREGDWARIEPARGDDGWVVQRASDDVWYRPTGEDSFAAVPPTEDPRLPGVAERIAHWESAGWTVRPIAHRVGRRVVLGLDGADRPPRIAKLYRRSSGQDARWEALARHAPTTGWRVPRVLLWDDAEHRLEVECVPGESLHERWRADRARAEDGDRIADLLAWLADAPVPDGFPLHTPEDEVGVLRKRLGIHERMLAEPAAVAGPLTDAVCEALADCAVDTWVITHRDLHDKQLLFPPGDDVVIDLDLCATAPAGLDRGNMLAQTRLRGLQGVRVPWEEITGRIAGRTGSARGPRALRVWTASALLRLGLLYALRDRPPTLVDDLLRSAGDALRGDGEWKEMLG